MKRYSLSVLCVLSLRVAALAGGFLFGLTGCATRIETPGMKFVTYGDSSKMKLDGPNGLKFYAENLKHTPAIKAAGHILTKLGALALAGVTGGTTGVAAIATKVPAVVHSASDFRNAPIDLRP